MHLRLACIVFFLCANVLLQDALAAPSGAGQRYRWTDSQGNIHYSDSLTIEAVQSGYDIMDANGLVKKHIERVKTAEEKTAEKAEQTKERLLRQQEEEQLRVDQQMLAAYPTEDALKSAQQQQLEMLDQNISSARVNLQNQEKSLSELLGHAAELEQAGQPVPADVTHQIIDVRKQIEEQRAFVGHKETERKNLAVKFEADIDHYRRLKTKAEAAQ